MARAPFKNAKGQWVVDLPADRFHVGPDGVRIEVRTSDLKPGGALYGIDSDGGDVDMVMLNGPALDPKSTSVLLRAPENPTVEDEDLIAQWYAQSGSPGDNFDLLVSEAGVSPGLADRIRQQVVAGGPLEGLRRKLSLGQMTAIPNRETISVHPRTLKRIGERKGELRPFLSDELMFNRHAHLPTVRTKLAKAISDAHRTSRAFVFDEAASYRVGEICSYAPDLIADQQEFARCPYPRTWIEIDSAAMWRAMGEAGLEMYHDGRPTDERLGFLYTERGIYTAASNGTMDAVWSPIAYRPHQPMRHDQEQRFCHDFGCSRMLIDQFMWGNAFDQLDPSRRRSLRAQHGIDVLLEDGVIPYGGLANMLRGAGAGDLKVALCAALLLIRPNLTVVTEERKPGRKLVLGKPTVFLAHRVVTVRLDPDRLVKRITRACHEERGRARARWHEVRGHYMHNHRAKVVDCIHDWREVEPLRWECARGCGGRRAWRTYPEGRGDASVGVVTKHYEVRP